jgi:membrane protein DedA with SNARE-associated domain
MIIWWTGRGLLAMPVLLASFILPVIGAVMLSEAYPNSVPPWIIPLSMVIGWVIGGAICWKLGRLWNRKALPGQYHALYSVRVEQWGVVFIALAVLFGALLVGRSLWSLLR